MPHRPDNSFQLLYGALKAIDRRCDGGRRTDGQGFTKFDMNFGRSVAQKDPSKWTEKMAHSVHGMLEKYRAQLREEGIDYDKLPVPERPFSGREILLYREEAYLKFDYDQGIIREIKDLPKKDRSYNPKSKVWIVDYRNQGEFILKRIVSHFGFVPADEDTRKILEDGIPDKTYFSKVQKISVVNEGFHIAFPAHDETTRQRVVTLSGAVRDKKSGAFVVPPTLASIELVKSLAVGSGFAYDPEVVEYAKAHRLRVLDSVERSSALGTDYAVDDFPMLRPYQRVAVEHVGRAKRTFICDQMGTGKTLQAIASVVHHGALPAVVICPASLKYNWADEVRRFAPGKSVEVLEGKRNGGARYDADFTVINYDVLADGYEGDEDVRAFSKHVAQVRKESFGRPGGTKKIREAERALDDLKSRRGNKTLILSEHAEAIGEMGMQSLIVDESHLIKSADAQRSKAVHDLAQGVPYVLLLTGTPVKSKPDELIHQLDVLGHLDDMGGLWGFAKSYLDVDSYGRIDASQAKNLDVLNETMRAKGFYLRRTKDQVLPYLPEKRYAHVSMKIDNESEYERAVEELVEWVYDNAKLDEVLLEKIDALGLSEEDREIVIEEHAESKAERALAGQAMVMMNVLRKIAARGKMRGVEEWVENYLTEGEKLIVFSHHTEITKGLAKRFDCERIDGSVPAEERNRIVKDFQENPDARLLILNMVAGGVGLTLTAAQAVAFVEYPWTPADYDQCFDRIHRVGATGESVVAYNLVARETIEESMLEQLEEKRAIVDAATDGHVTPPVHSESIAKDVLSGILKSRKKGTEQVA